VFFTWRIFTLRDGRWLTLGVPAALGETWNRVRNSRRKAAARAPACRQTDRAHTEQPL